jgi:hypothetical protein
MRACNAGSPRRANRVGFWPLSGAILGRGTRLLVTAGGAPEALLPTLNAAYGHGRSSGPEVLAQLTQNRTILLDYALEPAFGFGHKPA